MPQQRAFVRDNKDISKKVRPTGQTRVLQLLQAGCVKGSKGSIKGRKMYDTERQTDRELMGGAAPPHSQQSGVRILPSGVSNTPDIMRSPFLLIF
jgi:hypothetical protein